MDLQGEASAWDNASGARETFCAACGSRLATLEGDEVETAMGSFDEVGLFRPEYELWVIRREPWVPALLVPQHERNRPDG